MLNIKWPQASYDI